MVMQYVPARDMVVQVLAADGTTWGEVEGLDDIGLDPSAQEVMTDKTTYGSGGLYEGLKIQVGAEVQLTGKLMKDSVSGAQAPYQLRCTVLAAALAYAGLGQVRFRASELTDTTWTKWGEATFSLGNSGGGNNDLRTFTCKVGRNGASSSESVV